MAFEGKLPLDLLFKIFSKNPFKEIPKACIPKRQIFSLKMGAIGECSGGVHLMLAVESTELTPKASGWELQIVKFRILK